METQSESLDVVVITDPTPFEQLVSNMFCLMMENPEYIESFMEVLGETGYLYRCLRIKQESVDISKSSETSYFPTPNEFKILEKISEIVTAMKNLDIQDFFFINLGKVCGSSTQEVFEKVWKDGSPLYTTAKNPMERMITNLTFIAIHLSKETTKQFMGIVDDYDSEMMKAISSNIAQAYDIKEFTEENNREFPGEKELKLIKELDELGKNSGNSQFISTLLTGLWDVYGYERSRQILFTIYPEMKVEIEQMNGENIAE